MAVSAGADRKIRFCDAQSGREAATLEWHVGTVTSLTFSPDGETLATASSDGLIRLWPWRRLVGAP
jgi:WD40 repeat protein